MTEETIRLITTLAGVFSFALILAGVNERLNELFILQFVVNTRFERFKAHIALVSGLGISLAFGLDLLSPLAELFGYTVPYNVAAMIVTGILVGGGSNWLHDFVGRYIGKQQPSVVVKEEMTVTGTSDTTAERVAREVVRNELKKAVQ